jgi:hypothetical protein
MAILEFIHHHSHQRLLDAAMELFSHMGNVCDYLDGYVQLAKVEATFENTRYALQELACRNPNDIELQRGYGCDGIDNTCDSNKQIDECAEDTFPPDIDATAAYLDCSGWLADEATATECLTNCVVAEDNCKPVEASTSISSLGTCTPSIVVIATAQGYVERADENISTVTIPVKVEGTVPVVSCSLSTTGLTGSGPGTFEDAGFSCSVSGNCSTNFDVKIKMYSNEVETSGEDMVLVSTPTSDSESSSIYVQDSTCKNGSSGDCKVSNSDKSREYYVLLTATDEAGNVGK